MRRRSLVLGTPLVLAGQPWSALSQTQTQSLGLGRLLVIGGAEDKVDQREILQQFIKLSGGAGAPVGLITAASQDPQGIWETYRPVFEDMGITGCRHIDLQSTDAASQDDARRSVLECQGILLTGGDQRRLMQALWGKPVALALHQAFHEHGVCIAGTSAGASVLSRYMVALGDALFVPEKDAVSMDLGLGLVPNAVIDQHFSERRRLGRLLSALARRPDLLGLGIDEDTAVIIEPAKGLEVIGKGVATIVDCSEMVSNLDEVDDADKLELLGVKMHILPSGHRYQVSYGSRSKAIDPGGVLQAIRRLVRPGPIRLS